MCHQLKRRVSCTDDEATVQCVAGEEQDQHEHLPPRLRSSEKLCRPFSQVPAQPMTYEPT